jgi:hypothetical protein
VDQAREGGVRRRGRCKAAHARVLHRALAQKW